MKQPSLVIIPFANKNDNTKYVKGTFGGASMDRSTVGYSRNKDLILEQEPVDAFRKWYRGPYASFISEGDSTNYYKYSSEYTNAIHYKTNTVVVTEDTEVAPNGKLHADKLMPLTEGLSNRFTQQYITLGTGDHTFSVYAKYKGERYIRLVYFSAAFNTYAVSTFDLIEGIAFNNTHGSSKIESYANGWYKLSITGNSTISEQQIFRISLGDSSSEAGSLEDGILLWGGQVEEGLYASSQIPTGSSSETRGGDEMQFNAASGDNINTHFSAYFNLNLTDTGNSNSMITLTDGTDNNRVQVRTQPNGSSIRIIVVMDGELFSDYVDIGSYDKDMRILFQVGDNRLKVFINGEIESTNIFTNISFGGELSRIVNSNTSSSDDANRFVGLINEIMLFPMTLTDAEAKYLTGR